MGFWDWADSKTARLTWIDIGLIKFSVEAFVLMLAKLWPPLLSLDWYFYGIAFAVLAIVLLKNFWKS